MSKHRMKVCFKHEFQLFVAAFGTLLDLSGKTYLIYGRRILDRTWDCPNCRR